MNIVITSRLEEIELCLANDDINRAGVRLMDLVYDFDYPPNSRIEALDLRQMYNEGKELGKSRNLNENLIEEYKEFYERITQFRLEDVPNPVPPKRICTVKGITKKFRSRLHNFSFQPIDIILDTGKVIGIVGENGNGKTTLLRMLSGDLAIDSGKIEYDINGIPSEDWLEIKKKVAFVPQRIEKWYGRAIDNISFVAAIKGFNGNENKEYVDFIIHRMGLTNFRELKWDELSSGYRLRFEIAKALVWKPSILILDEPLANLDIQAQELLLQDLRSISDSLRNPVSIILSSQQLHEVETIADHIIFLKNGRAAFNGALRDFITSADQKTFELNGKFDYRTFSELFKDWEGVKIEKSASSFVITVPDQFDQNMVLNKVIDGGLILEYFRNITGSTKKLFNDKY